MPQPRKFDHDKAREMRADGLTYTRIAAEFDVSVNAVRRVVDPKAREKMAQATAARIRARREPCKGGCGRLVWLHGTRKQTGSGYCRRCHGIHRAETVRPTTLLCARCGEWKPDEDFFVRSDAVARRGRSSECRPCSTITRRAHRHANPEAQRAYDRQYYQLKRRRAANEAA